MIEKHIQRLEDLVKQSPDEFNDRYMRNTLVDSIKSAIQLGNLVINNRWFNLS
jgi:hypothetical protein